MHFLLTDFIGIGFFCVSLYQVCFHKANALHFHSPSSNVDSAGAAQVQVRSTSGANAVSEGLGTLSMVFALAAVASSGTLLQYYSGAEKFNAGAVVRHPCTAGTNPHSLPPFLHTYCC